MNYVACLLDPCWPWHT